ncbi:UNVERIFIED_CONTAM: hypothetical protein GTU68_034246 [Idotea baltica]|nr:hypothetical protein [Idotea baltica]
MIDVVGHNLANLNTAGYKARRASFADVFYETIRNGSGGVSGGGIGTVGGSNPAQLGNGSKLASVAVNHSQGELDVTGAAYDMALDGEGFFVVASQDGPLYTRAGAFGIDDDGYLVDTATGYRVQRFGTVGLPTGVLNDVAIDESGLIEGVASNGRRVALAQLAVARFRNQNGLTSEGNNMFRGTPASGTVELGAARTGGRGGVLTGQLESSNVDIAVEFTRLIIAQRGFSANARTITVADEILEELTNIVR